MSASSAGSLSLRPILSSVSSEVFSASFLVSSDVFSACFWISSVASGVLGAASLAFPVAPSASFGLGGSLGDEVDLGAEDFALSAAPLGADLGVLVADWAVFLGVSAALCDWPSFDVALDAGFLPGFVGVLGVLEAPLPAAGDGAILLEVRAVCGEGVSGFDVGF